MMPKAHNDQGFSPNSLKILKARYFLKNDKGEFIDREPSDLFRRVAGFVATAEKGRAERDRWSEAFFRVMMDRDFLPNSPTLTGAGRGMCLSACFVLPIEDSMDSIFDTVKNAALVHKEGGGTGFDFSQLRPRGSFVRKTQGIASGPVSFLRVIDAATEAVKQGGTRRGANIGILRVDHPDIEEFIAMKRDGRSLSNFNISAAVTDEFMKALKSDGAYPIRDPYTGRKSGVKKAREVFRLLVESAWAVGDPGLVFIDRINRLNPTKKLGPIRATNPCGEQPLHAYESCNLGSINVSNFYDPEKPGSFDRERFAAVVATAVRFLDDVVEVNRYPLPHIAETTRANRRIGLGVMGWADLLIKLGLRYDSPEALALADDLTGFMRSRADAESRKLGRLKGSFPNIEKSVFKGTDRRNATVLTIAPTGTISRIAGCSSSIEPVFAFEFTSRIMDGEIKDVHPLYAEWREKNPDAPLPDHYVTAHDIKPEGHIRMQAAFQKHVDNSVSKTINLPHDATEEDIEKAFLQAYELGTKGITVYRDGCKADQVLTKTPAAEPRLPKDRPGSLPSITDKIKTGFGNLYVTITFYNGKPFEVFTSIGKSGYSTMADAEALGRLISMALRSGVEPQEVIYQIKGIGGADPIFTEGGLVQSIPDAIAKVLERHLGEVKENPKDFYKNVCKMCGATMPDEKCPTCPNCGWNKCS
jgi:ribonucleoside-diphosphate reductase alpha chain